MEWLLLKIAHKLYYIFLEPMQSLWKYTIFTPAFFGALLFTLGMEKLFPVSKKGKFWSVSFAQDLVWFFYETVLHALILTTYVVVIQNVYHRYLDFLTIRALNELPYWGRFVIGVLFTDFLYWFQHFLNHKVPWFWEFHALHHSQKEINFFTDFRYHVSEYIVRETILTIPFLFLAIDIPTIISFSIFRTWYTRFYHGNIRLNLGWLRYLLVTPQSHRVHHSLEDRHRDLNFGAVFSLWDHLFGFQYKGYDEYPLTGVRDPGFPIEKNRGILELLVTPLVQMAYPFQVISRQLRQRSMEFFSRLG